MNPYGDYEVKITMSMGAMMTEEVMDPWGKIMAEGADGKTVSFLTKGLVFKGTLMEDPVERDQIDILTKEVKRFKDGNIRRVWVFKFQTDERDPADPEDKGVRNLWAKPDAIKAIKENLKSQGLSRMRPGGTLEIAWTGDRPNQGGYPTKLFTARYTEPPAGFMEEKKAEVFNFDSAPVATNSAQSPLDALRAMQGSGPQGGSFNDSEIPF